MTGAIIAIACLFLGLTLQKVELFPAKKAAAWVQSYLIHVVLLPDLIGCHCCSFNMWMVAPKVERVEWEGNIGISLGIVP